MESLTSVSPAIILPPSSTIFTSTSRSAIRVRLCRSSSFSGMSCVRRRNPISRRGAFVCCKSKGRDGEDGDEDGREDVERAFNLDGTIPGTSDEFVRRVSSRAYDMRRQLEQTFDSSSYDVLDSNPWREDTKPVYVLTHRENQLCTMKTRRNRSEVEKELGLLFSRTKQSRPETKFQMLVEDIQEGVLIFEDANEAVRYCDLLQGGGRGCEGVAEIEASSVFDICRKTRSLAVIFRRGRTPPTPQTLERNLRSRKRSLEDLRDGN
ncbi:PREDICTED: uncharacterized protein LOC104805179 [Tarenaya hassleriana]|uniref:uncharacterized protein LOC104805179 n=1 Tax=Tarenaya hassleriana TaxID=28532 RepID=UPI00053C8937|nr:PREDICTED: uncharacterized protein LOC104805179 [Tarenaya hassleriana]